MPERTRATTAARGHPQGCVWAVFVCLVGATLGGVPVSDDELVFLLLSPQPPTPRSRLAARANHSGNGMRFIERFLVLENPNSADAPRTGGTSLPLAGGGEVFPIVTTRRS